MTQRSSLRVTTRLLAATLVITPLLAACAGGGGVKKDTRYVARDVNTLYRAAQDRLDRKQYGWPRRCSTRSNASTLIRPGRAARS